MFIQKHSRHYNENSSCLHLLILTQDIFNKLFKFAIQFGKDHVIRQVFLCVLVTNVVIILLTKKITNLRNLNLSRSNYSVISVLN